MKPAGNVTLVPRRADILAVAATRIIEQAADLPDLGDSVLLLPDLQFAAQLRRHLLAAAQRHGHAALLGPDISTPQQWLHEHIPLDRTVPARARRELLLVEVLKQHAGVFPGSDPWQLAASLVSLFEELALHRVRIPGSLAEFTARLQTAYGLDTHLPEPLGIEAGIVHRLWHAWQVQLDADGLLDPGMACLQRLARHRASLPVSPLFLVGIDDANAAERDWLLDLATAGLAECFLYAGTPWLAATGLQAGHAAGSTAQDPVHACLEQVFEHAGEPPAARARDFAARHPQSPLAGGMVIFAANSAEQEALAIDVQVRRWLLDGRQPLGIVTEDRRLARRVRALLERAGIHLQDSGGWALSTTSAAAALERWLETVEEDFDHQPLLDVLKSPFVFPDADPGVHGHLVYRLEQDIIRHENIARGLARYRRHIDARRQRLPTDWNAATAESLHILLNRLDQAAEPLREFLQGEPATPLALLQALRASLEGLGMWEAFSNDPAGRRIQQEWQLLRDAAGHSRVTLDWIEFRAWFGSALERHDFRPATGDSPVLLLNLQQAQLGQYAGLVIAACDREHLPAKGAASPFFNDPVRRELLLPAWPERYALQLQRFRRVLESAPDTLLTWTREDNGEARLPCPWLEAIQTFHELAWGNSLRDPALEALVDDPGSRVQGDNPLPAPAVASHPAARLPAARLPASLTVSAHRSLIDCPYRFFAAYGLQLKPREAVREALEKSEYGSLVHQSLEIFHAGKPGHPAVFTDPINTGNRDAAIARLTEISRNVFTRDLEDNFEHRAWLRRWLVLIPAYIDWQSERQQAWSFRAAEQKGELELRTGQRLHGRLDRIDSGPGGTAIIDYKTGGMPKQADVDSGEDVQLASYALLTEPKPARVEYLQVDGEVRPRACLEGNDLEQLATAVRDRLADVLSDMQTGTPLPAWGDADTCRYCEMDGLCRRQAWLEAAGTAAATPHDGT
jgi:ATP-dependent helicase/nuclease subunit B